MAKAATKSAAKRAPAKKPAGKVVEAAMSGGGGGAIGGMLDPRAIEAAMGEAVTKAYADGITDDAKILKLKLAARDKVKADFRADEAKRLKAAQAEATRKA